MSVKATNNTINTDDLTNMFHNRKQIGRGRQQVATLIQIDHIALRINESNVLAIYDPIKDKLKPKPIRDIIYPYIFPAVHNLRDEKIISSYFKPISDYDLRIYNEKYSKLDIYCFKIGVKTEENFSETRNSIKNIILDLKEKQSELREFYNE